MNESAYRKMNTGTHSEIGLICRICVRIVKRTMFVMADVEKQHMLISEALPMLTHCSIGQSTRC